MIFSDTIKPIVAQNRGGWPEVSAEKLLYMTLWFLSNKETFRQIADRFNISKSCAFRSVYKTIDYFTKVSQNYIKWPEIHEMTEIKKKFLMKKGIPNVIGAIDGSYIYIRKPIKGGDDYVNRKQSPCIILQGIVDSSLVFRNIYVGDPGSMHDARVLRRSTIFKKAQEDENTFFNGNFLVGDSAYPSLNWLVPPFKDNGYLTEEQVQFNYMHSATRICVENAFGLLKGRFRRLNYFENLSINFIIKCVTAACVLHNICQLEKDLGNEFLLEENSENEEDVINGNETCTSDNVLDRRNELFSQLFPRTN